MRSSREIGDKSGEGTTLNNISQIYDARGDYDTALHYLEQSLEISREIGHLSGLCVTLFNMGHLNYQAEKVEEALSNWVEAYTIAHKLQEAQVLDAPAELAR